MTKDPNKKANVTIAEVARSAKKLQEEKDGNRIISDSSAPALSEFALNFEPQYKDKQRRAGSANKKKMGILLATSKLLERSPDMTAKQAWDELENADLLDWVLEIEDGKLFMRYEGTDPVLKQRKNPRPIKFKTYRTEYFRLAKEIFLDRAE